MSGNQELLGESRCRCPNDPNIAKINAISNNLGLEGEITIDIHHLR
jgi:hypothetical protein